MSGLSLILALAALAVAYTVWASAGRARREADAQLARLSALEGRLADTDVDIGRTLQHMADHFRRSTIGVIAPETIVQDAVAACPETREVFLAHRGDQARMRWDLSIREFARHAGGDLEGLMQELRAVQAAHA